MSTDELNTLENRAAVAALPASGALAQEARAAATAPRRRRLPSVPRASGIAALAIVAFALVAPLLAPHDISEVVGPPYAKPGEAGVLGTDHLGRDLLSRLLAGGRSLVLLAGACTLAAGLLGTALGLIAGYARGAVDFVLMRIIDLLLILPPLVVLLVLSAGWGNGTLHLIPVIMISASPYVARIVRAATVGVIDSPYIEAAVLRGESRRALLVREILPNISGPVLAISGLLLIYSIFVIASAGFLGVGAQPPAADWALMVKENMPGIMLDAWPVVLPALCIVALAVSVNLFADALHRRIAGGQAARRGA